MCPFRRLFPSFKQVLTCLLIHNIAGDGNVGYAHKIGGNDLIVAASRKLDDEFQYQPPSTDYTCKYRCDKVESFTDLKTLINEKLRESSGSHVKITICPTYKAIRWPQDERFIFTEKIDFSIECCGSTKCIIDGGLVTGDEMRLFALFNFRNASNVWLNRLTFQNIPIATNSSGSLLYFGSATDLRVSGSTIKNVQSMNGAIHVDLRGEQATGSVTVEDSKFLDNYSRGSGAGLNVAGFLRLQRNVFRRNRAKNDGGGVALDIGKLHSEDNIYEYNSAGDDGGAVFVLAGRTIFKNDYYSKNNAVSGGAVFIVIAHVDMLTSRFYGCDAEFGGAIYYLFAAVTSKGNWFSENTASTGGAIYNDLSVVNKATEDILAGNRAELDGNDVFLQQSGLFYCETNLLDKDIGMDSVSVAEELCDVSFKDEEDTEEACSFGCNNIKTFSDLKDVVENELENSEGSSVRVNMCPNHYPIVWPNEESLVFPDKIDFHLNCCGGKCEFDGNFVSGATRTGPAFDFMNVTKVFVKGMMFKNFAPVNRTNSSFFAGDGTILDFDEFVYGTISESSFENIRSQRGIISAVAAADLTLTRNKFLNNKAVVVGASPVGEGRVSVADIGSRFLTVVDNLVQGNTAELGLGAFTLGTGFIFSQHNSYIENASPNLGSAISGVAPILRSSGDVFRRCKVDLVGGCIAMFAGFIEMQKTRFEECTAETGGVFYTAITAAYVSEKSEYFDNEAAVGGAITASSMFTISKNDIFRNNIATDHSISASPLARFELLEDMGNAMPGKYADQLMGRGSGSTPGNVAPRTIDISHAGGAGDDVFVDDGSAFVWCGSEFSGPESVTGRDGGTALITEVCY